MRLSRAEQLLVLQHVAEALQFLHSRAPTVVHGDVKPANVLLRLPAKYAPRTAAAVAPADATPPAASSLMAKLSDFGCASVLSGGATYSFLNATRPAGTATAVGGTLHYQAPELQDDPPIKGTHNDVYSFAVMAVQMFDGKVPW